MIVLPPTVGWIRDLEAVGQARLISSRPSPGASVTSPVLSSMSSAPSIIRPTPISATPSASPNPTPTPDPTKKPIDRSYWYGYPVYYSWPYWWYGGYPYYYSTRYYRQRPETPPTPQELYGENIDSRLAERYCERIYSRYCRRFPYNSYCYYYGEFCNYHLNNG